MKSIIFGAALVLGLMCGEDGSLANLLQGSGQAHRHPRLSDVREQLYVEAHRVVAVVQPCT